MEKSYTPSPLTAGLALLGLLLGAALVFLLIGGFSSAEAPVSTGPVGAPYISTPTTPPPSN
ncbi:hypothetical protein CO046_02175 [Candidatus Peregrinibacteria bacterium CG_4_9_14_0_2_um_filter_53_11]|nr:MAG: hypothetical protein CO046_02175 [Candidatus Peregrinibacteria bacterium CG_4_9_14_0_2_um_filter_53_11]